MNFVTVFLLLSLVVTVSCVYVAVNKELFSHPSRGRLFKHWDCHSTDKYSSFISEIVNDLDNVMSLSSGYIPTISHSSRHGHGRRYRDLVFTDSNQLIKALPVDIDEYPESFQIVADIPGMNREDIKISIDKDILKIEVERLKSNVSCSTSQPNSSSPSEVENEVEKPSTEPATVTSRHKERYFGKIFRDILLPENADSDKISANYDKGVLTLTIPKKPVIEPKKIKIQ